MDAMNTRSLTHRPIDADLWDGPESENPMVWCDRCQTHHRRHTFTKADFDAYVETNAQRIADVVDAAIFEALLRDYPSPPVK